MRPALCRAFVLGGLFPLRWTVGSHGQRWALGGIGSPVHGLWLWLAGLGVGKLVDRSE